MSGVYDRVVIKVPQVIAWRPFDVAAAFRPCVITGVEPSDDIGKKAAGLTEANRQARKPIEHTRKDQLCGCQRRIEREPDQVTKMIVAHPLLAGHVVRMNEQRQVE